MQVIVVDDGSKDDTYDRLMRYSESFAARGIELMVVKQRNKGAAAAINRALKYVKGEFILLYDSDDVLYRDAIWSKVAFLQDHPDFGMVRSNGYVTNSPFELGRNFFTLETRQPEAILYDLDRGNAYNWAGSYMVRSGVLFEELGPDKEIYTSRYGQNLQIMMPVAGASKCGFINRLQMNYFVHQDSDSGYGGLPRTIERVQGYACNRRAIVHSLKISDEKKSALQRCDKGDTESKVPSCPSLARLGAWWGTVPISLRFTSVVMCFASAKVRRIDPSLPDIGQRLERQGGRMAKDGCLQAVRRLAIAGATRG